jgi:hypothetical protein
VYRLLITCQFNEVEVAFMWDEFYAVSSLNLPSFPVGTFDGLNAAGSLKAGVPQVFYTGEVGGAEAAQ